MSNTKKLMMTAAGGDAVNVEDVFSAYAYDGNSSTQTITNGIDLDGEGGMVWIKGRNNSDNSDHLLFDTERGATKWIRTNATSGTEITNTNTLTGFNSDGFDVGSYVYVNGSGSASFPDRFISYAFRKHPNFFNVKKFTTSYNTEPHTISTGLDSDLGMAWFRSLDNSTQGTKWTVWHRERQGYYTNIGSTINWLQSDSDFAFNTSTQEFTLGYPMSDAGSRLVAGNQETQEVIGYFFAHNNNDGVFGPTGDQDIIKCGIYTGNSGTTEVNLGFKAGFVLIKHVNANSPWLLYDLTRGMGQQSLKLLPPYGNRDADEGDTITSTSTGFRIISNSYDTNSSGNDYCYMAIRAGDMETPINATDVFAMDWSGNASATDPWFTSDFPVDLGIHHFRASGANNHIVTTRDLQGYYLKTNKTDAKAALTGAKTDYMDGYFNLSLSQDTGTVAHMWKRAPGFFDSVNYVGNGTAGRTVSHNLGVAPEMMWIKATGQSYDWMVYHKDLGNGTYSAHQSWLKLNATNAQDFDTDAFWNNTAPTSTVFSLNNNTVNQSGQNFQAYLFATLPGISKVGSYTGNGNSGRVIDCGFSTGARFVLARSYTHADNWFLFDSQRGIVAGNDPYFRLNTNDQEITNADLIDTHSSGFIVNNANGDLNDTGRSYIFYAVA